MSDLFQVAQCWKGSEENRLIKRRNLAGQLLVTVDFRHPLVTYTKAKCLIPLSFSV